MIPSIPTLGLAAACISLLTTTQAAPVTTLVERQESNFTLPSSGTTTAFHEADGALNMTTTDADGTHSVAAGCAAAPMQSGADMGIALKSATSNVQTATECPDQSAGMASSYECDGSVARKQQLYSLGADSLDMSIAMLEVGQSLTADYPLGDGKGNDAANFSIFKYNWFMIRTACSQFAGQQQPDWNNGAVLNTDDAAAILCLREQLAYFGTGWWGAQRDGSNGVNLMDSDIQSYKDGAQAIQNYLDQGHLTDNMCAYKTVAPI